jgi:hypothetical protein
MKFPSYAGKPDILIIINWALFALGLSEIILVFTKNNFYGFLSIALASCFIVIHFELIKKRTLKEVCIKSSIYIFVLIIFKAAYSHVVLLPGSHTISLLLRYVILIYPTGLLTWYLFHKTSSNE